MPGPLIGPFESGGALLPIIFNYISNYEMLPKINKLLLQWPQQTQHTSELSILGSGNHRVVRTNPIPTGHSNAMLFRGGLQILEPSWEVMGEPTMENHSLDIVNQFCFVNFLTRNLGLAWGRRNRMRKSCWLKFHLRFTSGLILTNCFFRIRPLKTSWSQNDSMDFKKFKVLSMAPGPEWE